MIVAVHLRGQWRWRHHRDHPVDQNRRVSMGGQGLQNAARKTKLNETVKKGSLKGEKVGAER